MLIRLIPKESYEVHSWAGGDTAEIFHYPADTSWQEKNFEIRISTANCRIDNMPYTDFTGWTRHITPLAGTLHIFHEGHHDKVLQPMEVDVFDGGWKTRSEGVVPDLNLLHTDAWEGRMARMSCGDEAALTPRGFTGFFSCADRLIIELSLPDGKRTETLRRGDFLLVQLEGAEEGAVKFASGVPGEGVAMMLCAGSRG